MRSLGDRLLFLYETLLKEYGPQGWWPVDREYHRTHGTDEREEIVIGAVLTQNTAWKNVERALSNLKRVSALSFDAILGMPLSELERLIKPSGYYRQKAVRLKEVCGSLNPVEKVGSISREELLSIKGVGRETADAILLYAGERPYFVIDAYTRRLLGRLFGVDGGYEEIREFFEENLPQDVSLFKEFHALIDEHAKRFCRKRPICDRCPVYGICGRFGL